MWKKPRRYNLQIRIIQTDIWEKKFNKKEKKRLMAPVLFENNQIELR